MTPHKALPSLAFVTCVSNLEVFQNRLLRSPCLQAGGLPLSAHWNCESAAVAFNSAMQANAHQVDWLVWMHQDVYLPDGFDQQFAKAIQVAETQFPAMAVAGVYGVKGFGLSAMRAGAVLDRGRLLKEANDLPFEIDSLDELLFAVRVGSGLTLDASLAFDFYGTDVVLKAQQKGLQGVVVDAFCEHWSSTPAQGPVDQKTSIRIRTSAAVFEAKWRERLPLSTPCFEINRAGDVARFIDEIVGVKK